MKAFIYFNALLTFFWLSPPALAAVFTVYEVGDAGDLPGSAQPTATGPISAIRGTLNGVDDIDLYAILIPDLSLFSATTVSSNTEFFDTQLFLFDELGIGVAANDDTDWDLAEFNATIPAGALAGAPGVYLLAVAEFTDRPVSIGGRIFPDQDVDEDYDYEGIHGPTGPGGAGPLIGWNLDGDSESLVFPVANYEIILSGAQGAQVTQVIPEPSTLTGVLILFPLAAAFHRRNRRLHQGPPPCAKTRSAV